MLEHSLHGAALRAQVASADSALLNVCCALVANGGRSLALLSQSDCLLGVRLHLLPLQSAIAPPPPSQVRNHHACGLPRGHELVSCGGAGTLQSLLAVWVDNQVVRLGV